MAEHNVWLRRELAKWRSEGVINERQAEALLSRYQEKKAPERKLVAVLGVLGAALVGAGVILFVAANWELLPKFLKLALLFISTLFAFYAGWEAMRRNHPLAGSSLAFLATILVGATIFLTAQIFNVNADAHWLILLWFLAVAPLAHLLNSRPILLLSITLLTVWLEYYLMENNQFDSPWSLGQSVTMFYGVALYGLGLVHKRWKGWQHFVPFYQGVGVFLVLAVLFFFSIFGFESVLSPLVLTGGLTVLLVVSAVVASGLALVYSFLSARAERQRGEFYFLFAVFGAALFIALPLLGLTYSDRSLFAAHFNFPQFTAGAANLVFILSNLLFFALNIGAIFLGHAKRTPILSYLGLAFFFFGTTHLYVTTVYEFLPRSLAFVLGGFLLLGGGFYLERKRQFLLGAETKKGMDKKALLLVLLAPVVVIALFLIVKTAALLGAQEIQLRVRPVDPRDFFRGDYVNLNYDISRIPLKQVPYFGTEGIRSGDFYAILEKRGEAWELVRTEAVLGIRTGQVPQTESGQVCLKGEIAEREPWIVGGARDLSATYGIESFFVPEGRGKEIEFARDADKVTAVVAVNRNCVPTLKTLLIDGKPLDF